MTNDEVNKTIAEFEFGNDYWTEDGLVEWEYGEGRYNHAKRPYTESLDSLVPVWEKLNLPRIYEIDIKNGSYSFYVRHYTDLVYQENKTASTIQQAAAIATAKVIRELGAV